MKERSRSQFRHDWDYLEAWFAVLGPLLGPEDDIAPFGERRDLFRKVRAETGRAFAAGVHLPLEAFVREHKLGVSYRLLLLALVRDALDPNSKGGLTLHQPEVSSPLRDLQLVECDLDPLPARRFYRLAPPWLQVFLPGEQMGTDDFPREYDAMLDVLCRDVKSLVDRLAWDFDPQALFWSGPARDGPGWDHLGGEFEMIRTTYRRRG